MINFFDNFDTLTAAPNGMPKLRELILQLAVRGKLVQQDPEDEPAGLLLERVKTLREKVARENKLRLPEPDDDTTDNDLPVELPSGWTWTRLGAIVVKLGAGSTPLGGKQVYEKTGIKFLRSQNVWNNGLRLDDVAFIPEKIHRERQGTIVESGDILLNITGASIGRCALVPDDFDEANVSQHVTIVRLADKSLRHFLHLCMMAPSFQETIMAVQVGVSREGLSMNRLKEFVIALPPLPEQHRIVAKVDKLMALCDELEARQRERREVRVRLHASALNRLLTAQKPKDFSVHWRRIRDHFDLLHDTPETIPQLRQAILQLAVRGKLVAQEPEEEPAELLLKKIEKEKKILRNQGRLTQPIREIPVEESEMTFALPSGWVWTRMTDISDHRLGKMLDKAKNKGQPYPYLRNINVQWLRFDLSDAKEMLFEERELEEYEVRVNDLLVCEGGEPGRCAVWDGRIKNMKFQKAIHRVRPLGGVNPWFLQYKLLADARSGSLDKHFTGATITHFTGQQLARYVIALPPLSEQHRIVAKVDELMALCDALEARLTQGQALSEQLLESTVHHLLAA